MKVWVDVKVEAMHRILVEAETVDAAAKKVREELDKEDCTTRLYIGFNPDDELEMFGQCLANDLKVGEPGWMLCGSSETEWVARDVVAAKKYAD